jgi:protein-L-isoaspartate(D-aspartate) O-methyltransferase
MPDERRIDFRQLRQDMVREQLWNRDVTDERVLDAMLKVPRHLFVPGEYQAHAYKDGPLPIGLNQTISQPYMVAMMTQLLQLRGDEIVLEIGTGSGYQTAILAELAAQVYSIERHKALAQQATDRLHRMKYANVKIFWGDGTEGLAQYAPYNAILVAATGPHVPEPLRQQMADQGRMVLPIDDGKDQYLYRVFRQGDHWQVEKMFQVRFVPLLGRFGFTD